ncbi:hypothetical protein [Thermoplasma volcanium GSS1]|uniref:Uncharacterized protein n=1 Tax=Thermoplasma volcanium (strain ATCC 51530 / DSM 4299 / JCM 9571 / NBRC 15438 / GSS1) TaxID=273116 RepID=Q97C01_THEVO|nr:TatD family hydrolase [Thermoplasma volcanium]BAB59446.1 hypothetical protein [Thermoplasma volcanium GSS1]
MYKGRVFDNHFHLNPGGNYKEAIGRFIKAGGTSINLTNLPLHDRTSGYYENLYEWNIKMSEKIRSEFGIEVVVTIGPYPFDYQFFSNAGLDPINEMRHGLELAAKLVSEEKADAIGEIGYPHIQVDKELMDVYTEMLSEAFEIAGNIDSPVILHTYDLDCKDYERLESLSSSFGKNVKVVKHHARPNDLKCNTHIFRSIGASRKNVIESTALSKKFLLETDFIDDPLYRNKYLPPDSVPKRALMIQQQIENADELLYSIFEELPAHIYGRLKKTSF